jgi:hypothetical protein
VSLKFENYPRKNLVIAAVGDQSLHTYWIPKKKSSYDLFLINYGSKSYKKDAKYYIELKGSKFNLIKKAIQEYPEILDYSFFWMPDDDVYIANKEIDRLFNYMSNYDLWIGQPSIIGWYGLAMTLNNPNCFLRYTNYVEIMCPCFSRYALDLCIKTFELNKTGYGIDSLWNVILDHPTNKLSIIDDVVAMHTREVGGGDMYKLNANNNLDEAMEEARKVYRDYNLGFESFQDLKKGRLVSQEIFGVEYARIHKEMETGVQRSERLFPNNEVTKILCNKIKNFNLQ